MRHDGHYMKREGGGYQIRGMKVSDQERRCIAYLDMNLGGNDQSTNWIWFALITQNGKQIIKDIKIKGHALKYDGMSKAYQYMIDIVDMYNDGLDREAIIAALNL